ncbi:MAG: proton-conducting transporter membrane subunit [Polyangiaceae bacterium]
MLAILVLVPIAVIFLQNLPFRSPPRAYYTMAVLILAFAEILAAITLPDLVARLPPAALQILHFALTADQLTRVLLASIGIVLGTAVLVGQRSFSSDRQHRRFANLLLISLTGMNATVLSSDFFTLYVFLEVVSVSSFILVALDRGLFAVEGAFRYLILSALASTFMLSAVALLALACGGTSFEVVRSGFNSTQATLARLGVIVFAVGMFIKGGVVPFHAWLPGAYASAPAAVSILLAGIVTKVSGVYTLARITYSIYVPDEALATVLLALGTASMVLGAILALSQADLKRMLAYSSISQIGYVVVALGCASELGVVAAAFHIFNHAVFKALLFVGTAAVESKAGTTELHRLAGIGSKMPVTCATTTIGMLSAAGFPPFAGFFSKLLIVLALWKSGHTTYGVIAILASILTLSYLLSMQRQMLFGKPNAETATLSEADASHLVPAIFLAFLAVFVGVLFPLLLHSPLSFLLLNRKLPW